MVLALTRLWYAAEIGDIATKDAAATWPLDRVPTRLHPLRQRSKAIYLGDALDDLAAHPIALEQFIHALKDRVDYALSTSETLPPRN